MDSKEAWELLQDALSSGAPPNSDFSKFLSRHPLTTRDVAGVLAVLLKTGGTTSPRAAALVEQFYSKLEKQSSSSVVWDQVAYSIFNDFAQLQPFKPIQDFMASPIVLAWKRCHPGQSFLPGQTLFLHDPELLVMAVLHEEEVRFDPNTWGSIPLVEAVLRFCETNPQVMHLLVNQGKVRNPDLLLLSLVSCHPREDNVREELYAHLVPQLLLRSAGLGQFQSEMDQQVAFRVLKQVWHVSRELVLRGVIELFPKQFEILQIILRLPDGLELLLSLPTRYSLAACFFAYEQFDLEKWLADKAVSSVEPRQVFVRETLQFVLAYQQTKLKRDFVALLFRVLQVALLAPGLNGGSSEDQKEQEQLVQEVRAVLEQCRIADPLLLPPQPQSQQPPPPQPQQPQPQSYDDVEKQANARFQMIYSGEMDIDEAIQMLARFKDSANEREQAIFACMIHNLFDEYRFFHDYPDKELRITAIFFGKLIQKQVVSSWTLSMAINYVMDALRSNSDKNFAFGLLALQQFLPRLPTMLHVVDDLLGISNLQHMEPNMYYEIEQIKRATAGTGASAERQQRQAAVTPSSSESQLAAMTISNAFDSQQQQYKPAANNESLALRGSESGEAFAKLAAKLDRIMFPVPAGLEQDPPSPGVAVQDQVIFLINNLSPATMDERVLAARTVFVPSIFPWVASFLVNGRISSQPNYHSMYMEFLDRVGEKELLQQIRLYALLLVRRLLLSNKLVTSTNERSVLKSMGSWLGLLTLAKNKPLLQVELDLKELLLDGYERGWLIAIVPFVAKILEGAKESKVFGKPTVNPWMRAIFGCLAEIGRLPDLKLNVNFEVEILFRCFGTEAEMASITPTSLISGRIKPKMVGNPDFTVKIALASTPSTASSLATASAQSSSALAASSNSLSSSLVPSVFSGGSNNRTQAAGLSFTQSSATGGNNASFSSSLPPQQYYDARGATAAAAAAATDKASSSATATGSAFETMIPGVHMYVFVNSQLAIFVKHPELKGLVPVAFDRAIREIIQPAVERSVTISTYTTKELISKDFAAEPSEQKMQRAAHLMASNLAGALALMTCKELLKASMAIHLRQLFLLSPGLSQDDMGMVDTAIRTCCDENLELGCMLIEKAATEKAARDIDEALEMAYQNRKDHHAATSEPFFDHSVFNTGGRYPASLPGAIRPAPREGGLSPEHLQVYEAFQKPRVVVGATAAAQSQLGSSEMPPPPPPSLSARAASIGTTTLTAPQALERYKQVVSALDVAVQKLLQQPGFHDLPTSMLPPDHEVLMQLGMVCSIVASTVIEARFDVAVVLAQSVFKRLYDGSPTDKLRLSVQVGALEAISSALDEQGLRGKITEWVFVSIKSGKLNVAVTCALVDAKLVNVLALDELLSEALLQVYFQQQQQQQQSQQQVNPVVVFAMELVQRCVVQSRVWQVADCQKILNNLRKFGTGVVSPVPGLSSLFSDVADLRPSTSALPLPQSSGSPPPGASAAVAAAQRVKDSGVRFTWTRSADVSQPMRDNVQYALQLWLEVLRDGTSAQPVLQFIAETKLLKNPDGHQELFFYLLTELAIESYLALCCTAREQQHLPQEAVEKQMRLAYVGVDSYATLVCLLAKLSNEQGRASLVALALESIARVMSQDVSQRLAFGHELGFDQRPYFRVMLNLQRELLAMGSSNGGHEMLAVFAEALHLYFPPDLCPGFCFSWLDLVSHHSFMPKLLRLEHEGGWGILHELLLDLFCFLEPYLGNASLTPSVRQLYKGTLRVLLVLLHDFPEFLCFYHFSLCNVIPTSCVQLRNLILSAFPRTMRLPDPFTQNLKVDLLAEIEVDPKILSNYTLALEHTGTGSSNLKMELDQYLTSKTTPVGFLQTLSDKVLKEHDRTGTWDCLNALVLYVGIVSIAKAKELAHTSGLTNNAENNSSFAMSKDIYQTLAVELTGEARYMFLNAIANHLRYPNSQTHFFSCVILGLFKDVPEQVTRVLLERLISQRPHPWGLLVSFIELIKNNRYGLWEHSFTRITPEIQKVFESVAASCGANPTIK